MKDVDLLVRPSIKSLKPYSSARDDYKGEGGMYLDANENPYGYLNRYPDPYQRKLKGKISELKGVDQNQIFIGNGSDEVIDMAFRIFCQPGVEKALTFVPTYGMYEVSAAINQVDLIKIPLNDNFQIDWEMTLPLLNDSDLKLIFICSPNNPTGNVIDGVEKLLKSFNGIVFVDEAYIDFSNATSAVALLKSYSNLIVSQTFSKAWGLAAARVGLAFMNESLLNYFNKVKPPYNVSELNQLAAVEALNRRNQTSTIIQEIISERQRLEREISICSVVKRIYPSDANFLLVEVEDANVVYQNLVNEGVIVRNRSALVPNCLRISIGTKGENDQLIRLLKGMK